MFILVQEPSGEESKRAFEALDDALGTEEFSEATARKVMAEHGFGKDMLERLVDGGYVSETD